MLHYKIHVDIRRPVDLLFETMTQIDNSKQMMDEVVDSKKLTDGPVGLGTRMSEHVKQGPASELVIWVVTAFERDQLCTFEAVTSFGLTKVSYMFESIKRGTRVSAEVNIHLTSLYRIFQPVIQYVHKKNRMKNLATIKSTLEMSLENPSSQPV